MTTTTKTRVVTFGEIMLRLAAPDGTRLAGAQSFDATYGGGEANVAASLAGYGLPAAFVSRVPANDLGEWIGAGATCLGFGSALVTRAHTDPGSDTDPSDLTPAVAALIDLVAAARAANRVPFKESRP